MNQIVATVMGKQVTRGQLDEAFKRVQNPENWKMPISTSVDVNDWEKALLHEAIIFFTGSVPTWIGRTGATLPRCRYTVKAAGYYAAVGA